MVGIIQARVDGCKTAFRPHSAPEVERWPVQDSEFSIIGALAALVFPSLIGAKSGLVEPPAIGISMYNYARIPESDLALARRTASRIFRQAGLEIVWADVPVAGGAEAALRRTGRRLGAADIRLRILSESKVPEWARDTRHVAFSLLPKNGGFGTITSIYSQRLLAIARRETRPAGLVLGCVIAHEVGHLLMGMRGHSRSDIMSFPVTGRYLSEASAGRLHFTLTQARRIRKAAEQRRESDSKHLASREISGGRQSDHGF